MYSEGSRLIINTMKQCTKCKKWKPFDGFNFRVRVLGLLQYQCKECTRIFIKSHYERNREYYLNKAKKRNTKIRLEVRNYIRNYLSTHPCVDCTEADITVLEFDHRGDKFKEVSLLARGRYSLQKVQIEIAKCDIRCANCHRRKTAKEFGWFKNTNVAVA